ncbi:MAG TPA: hypothetical protein VHP34_03285 [Alphaproteobacteria bacterium]|jgi:hypothetical protein|nr:hypothetical protein [Alphaproteobacteria bacterium]
MTTHTITALCKDRASTEDALRRLEDMGFTKDQISLLMNDATRGRAFRLVEGTKADEGAAAGATFGGVTGAIIGSIGTAGALAIPGFNVVVVGALAGALAGLGAGAAAGGILGALIGAGIPEHEAKVYEKELSAGSILIAVDAENEQRAKQVRDVLRAVDATDIAA